MLSPLHLDSCRCRSVCACCPICVPSRTTIMTGLHGYESGVVSNATHETVMRKQTRPKAHGIGECEMEPVISTVEVKDSITTWIVDQSIDFLETRDTPRPFSSGPASPSPILPLIPAGTSRASRLRRASPAAASWRRKSCQRTVFFMETAGRPASLVICPDAGSASTTKITRWIPFTELNQPTGRLYLPYLAFVFISV